MNSWAKYLLTLITSLVLKMDSLDNYKPTLWLIEKIDNAILNLTPQFSISNRELMKFEKPRITRAVDVARYGGPPLIPAYHPEFNLFFFPWKNFNSKYVNDSVDYFSQAIIHHEAGHYLHYSLNSKIPRNVLDLPYKFQKEHYALGELVAEYGNFILGINNKEHWKERWEFLERKGLTKTYLLYGRAFLPSLARMSLEEAIKTGILSELKFS